MLKKHSYYFPPQLLDCLKTLTILMIVTIIAFIFQNYGLSEANIVTIYILGVLLTAIVTTGRIYSLTLSIIGVFIFNFFFTHPYFTLKVNDPGYWITFFIMFLAALISSHLTIQIKENALHSAQTAYRTQILLETNQLLQKEKSRFRIIEVTCQQLEKLLNRNICFYVIDHDEYQTIYAPASYHENLQDQKIIQWVFKHHQDAGAYTSYFSNDPWLYMNVQTDEKRYGMIGILIDQCPLEEHEKNMVMAILGEMKLTLDNEQANREKAEADFKAKNEQLRADLLRSISHDLRTPLTSISGNAGILLTNGETLENEKKEMIYHQIYDDSMWLIQLVENLLSITRIENGTMNIHMTTELIDEVITEALEHIDRDSQEHDIHYHAPQEFLFVKMDTHLMMQVMINLMNNAIKHTPPKSRIDIFVYKQDKNVIVDVVDDGYGISDDMKKHVFDMFYTGNKTIADSQRSLGLGLALCQSIMHAHHGTIQLLDHQPHGCIFRLTLAHKEVQLHDNI